MSLTFDGGDFSNDIAGDVISGNSSNTPSLTYLYQTGNTRYNYFHHTDAYVTSMSGNFRNFYSFDNSQSFRLINDTGYIQLNSGGNLIYSETSGIYPVRFQNFGGGVTSIDITAKNEWRTFSHTYYPDEFDPSQHLLIVYNQNNPNSIGIKDYYLLKRTGFATANLLAISCSPVSGDNTSVSDYTGNIRSPIINFLQSNPSLPIRYIVLLYDIPFRVSGVGGAYQGITGNDGAIRYSVVQDLSDYLYYTSGYRSDLNETRSDSHIYSSTASTTSNGGPSIPDNYLDEYSISKFRRTPVLVTHLSARNPADVSGYINKITTLGVSSGYYLKGDGRNNTYIVCPFSGANSQTDYTMYGFASGVNKFCNNSQVRLFFDPQDFSLSGPVITGGNLAGFVFHGTHHSYNSFGSTYFFNPQYAYNGSLLFTGYNWYIMATRESYNGINFTYTAQGWKENDAAGGGPLQGSIFSWLRPTAFSSTSYEDCPVGAVGHTNEPGDMENDYSYLILWNSGLPFIEAAYRSRMGSFNNHWTCMGDPLLLK